MEGAEDTSADGTATVTAMPDVYAVDLFAGPGGWDEGLLDLGIRPVGVEWDDAACLTRAAAGHATRQADVSELDPAELVPAGGHVDLLIGSPPCPTFSAAGGGSGHRVVDVILKCLDSLRAGRDERPQAREKAYEALLPDAIEEERARAARKHRAFRQDFAEAKARRNANMSVLVVEPFRYALEQVPPVLPIWERTAVELRALGWNVWTGLLSSERFGVPQTRERAILLADLERPVGEPTATHQRYVPPRKGSAHDRLFDPGRRERIVVRGEENLTPWISMAAALGWAVEDKPSPTPAPTLDGHVGRWMVDRWQTNAPEIDAEERPAPTVSGKAGGQWTLERPAPTIVGGRRSKDGMLAGRQLPPGEGENVGGWGYERPSTTVAGDPRVPQPGYKMESSSPGSPRRMQDAVRLSVPEASILQGFRPDYPWQGSRTAQFTQIGNAVPPPLARACIASLVG